MWTATEQTEAVRIQHIPIFWNYDKFGRDVMQMYEHHVFHMIFINIEVF